MARDSCIVVEALSTGEAKEIAKLLTSRRFDVEREETLIWCFVVGTNPRRRRTNIRNPGGL